ncbi:Flp family type IVb pilin [Devosia sp.]|uniref:Flp family type IVb pilin n=1 Tax=Devosia sp. TaxID=1871048 RepID=UPI002AFE766B|nr:Flp family type IVb pilin [Devosia sp.]
MTKIFARLMKDESGATAIEYALIGTLIAVALVGTATIFGDTLRELFDNGATDVIATQVDKL